MLGDPDVEAAVHSSRTVRFVAFTQMLLCLQICGGRRQNNNVTVAIHVLGGPRCHRRHFEIVCFDCAV